MHEYGSRFTTNASIFGSYNTLCSSTGDPPDIKDVLDNHRSTHLYSDETMVFRITVRRSNIWEDAHRALKRTFDEKKHVRITFLGESAVDGGGPRREFFMLLMNAIKENNSLLDGPSGSRVLRHNTAALQEELYLCMGKMIALSIVHGGPGKFILLMAHTKLHPCFEHKVLVSHANCLEERG